MLSKKSRQNKVIKNMIKTGQNDEIRQRTDRQNIKIINN